MKPFLPFDPAVFRENKPLGDGLVFFVFLFMAGMLIYLPFIVCPVLEYVEEIQRMRVISENHLHVCWNPFNAAYRSQFYRPVSLFFEYVLFKSFPFSPRMAHLGTAAFNLINGLLLFYFLRIRGLSRMAGIFIFFLFLLSPAALQSATSVHDQLYVFFFLLIFIYLGRRDAGFLQDVLVLGALEVGALMSKDAAIVFPVCIILYGLYLGFSRKIYVATILFLLLLAIYLPGRISANAQIATAAPTYQLQIGLSSLQFAFYHFIFNFIPPTARIDHLFIFPGTFRIFLEKAFTLISLLSFLFLLKTWRKIAVFSIVFITLLGPSLMLSGIEVHRGYLAAMALASVLGYFLAHSKAVATRSCAIFLALALVSHAVVLCIKKYDKAKTQSTFQSSLGAFLKSHENAESIVLIGTRPDHDFDLLPFRVINDFADKLAIGAPVFEKANYGLGRVYFYNYGWVGAIPSKEPAYYLKVDTWGLVHVTDARLGQFSTPINP